MSLKPREMNFDEIWPRLRDSIEKIMALQQVDRTTWDDNFHDIYALCVAIPENHSKRLYDETRKCMEDHVKKLCSEVTQIQDDSILNAYFTRWHVFYKGAKFVNNLFSHLNNRFIKKQKFVEEADIFSDDVSGDRLRALMEVSELALDNWKRMMIQPVEKKMVTFLMSAINDDREGKPVQQNVVLGVVQSFMEVDEHKPKETLKLYQTLFESKFLEQMSIHYKKETQRLFEGSNCSEYMKKVATMIRDEDLRARKFLHPSSYENVSKMCREVMVADHINQFHSEVKTMVEKEEIADLQNMFTLLKPLPSGVGVLVKEFENYVKRIANESVQNLKGENVPQQFVDNILKVYNKYNEMARTVSQNDLELIGALDRACLYAINFRDDTKPMPGAHELLANFTGQILRKSAKPLSEEDLEKMLTSAVVIFRYIEDKDIFQKLYQNMLAQRLINGTSVSMEAEESMINKLKHACVYEITNKFRRMFTDIGTSVELTNRFVQSCKSETDPQNQLDIGFQIQVLQEGAWPLQQPVVSNFTVPIELSKSVKLFEEFYNRNQKGRKLNWFYHLSHADVVASFDRQYQITMTVHQMAIVLQFNAVVKCTVEDLKVATQLHGDVLQKNLKSLIDCELLKCEKVDQLDDKAEVLVNLEFKSKRAKFKIAGAKVQKPVEKEVEQANSSVQNERKYFLQCAIVRIMKARKVSKHNQLIQEVINQCRPRFSPEIASIKKMIEELIEKQYLQRTENPEEYNYVV